MEKKKLLTRVMEGLKGDKLIWGVVFVISMISLLAVYTGAGNPMLRRAGGSSEFYLLKHFVLMALSFGIMYFVSRFDYRIFAKISTYMMYIALPVLLITLFIGTDANGAVRWINLFGLSVQPSDFAKVALLIHLAKVITEKQSVMHDFKEGLMPVMGWILATCALIGVANLSTALLLLTVSFMMLFIGGISMKHLLTLIGGGGLMISLLFSVGPRAETWQSRLGAYYDSLFDENYEPGHQVKQAYGAIAKGGILGQGAGKSTQRNWVPLSTSDMIYPIILEEFGLLGGLFVLGLYLFLLFRVVGIVTMSKTFGALLAAGLAFLMVVQALLNMAVAVGLMPVTGLPLPMLSMGGTSMIFSGFALGLILSVSNHALEQVKNPEQEVAAS
jgi:cell division protein FtsW